MKEAAPPPSFGDYVPVRAIARGAQGAVYEVRSRTTGARFAAKHLLQLDERARGRFRREAELLARCDRHRGIVKVHAFGSSPDGSPYMILDLVEGESLDVVLKREGRMEPTRAATIARDVAHALGHAHALGIVHRDVKPSNVILDQNGEARLTDFGVALHDDVERLTRTGMLVGTPHYISPEQARSGHAAGPTADVFSLGCALFHMLAGEPPIPATSVQDLIIRLVVASEPLRNVRSAEGSVPRPIASVVAWALEREPDHRPANGTELARALDEALAGRDPRPARGRARRRARLALAALAGVTSLVVGLVVGAPALAARRELEAARREIALARVELAAVKAAGKRAGADSCREGAARAAEALAHARAALAHGSGQASTFVAEATGLARDLAILAATGELERGSPTAALTALAAMPEDAAIPADRLLHARALLAAGKGQAAADEALSLEQADGALRTEATELEGDACVASSVAVPRGIAAYTRALAAGPRHPGELHEKRAAACALAGDDAGALADLGAAKTFSHVAALPEAMLARLAPVAPALYRRALATDDPRTREQFLELALRIAPAPAALAGPAARAWLDLSLHDLAASHVESAFFAQTGADTDVARFEPFARGLEKAARARAIDPAVTLGAYRKLACSVMNAELLLPGARRVTEMAKWHRARLLAAWPDDPFMLVCEAHEWTPGAGERFVRAARALPPPESDDENDPVRVVANTILEAWANPQTDEIAAARPRELVLALARLVGDPHAWLLACQAEHGAGRHEIEPELIENARKAIPPGSDPTKFSPPLLEASVYSAWDRADYPVALEFARARLTREVTSEKSGLSVRLVADTLLRLRRFDEAVAVVGDSYDTTAQRVKAIALEQLGRHAEADTCANALERAGGTGPYEASLARKTIRGLRGQ